jgi:hypothetical protein
MNTPQSGYPEALRPLILGDCVSLMLCRDVVERWSLTDPNTMAHAAGPITRQSGQRLSALSRICLHVEVRPVKNGAMLNVEPDYPDAELREVVYIPYGAIFPD